MIYVVLFCVDLTHPDLISRDLDHIYIKSRSKQNRSPTRSNPIDKYQFLPDCYHFYTEKKLKNYQSLEDCNVLNNGPIFIPRNLLESSWSPGGLFMSSTYV